MSEDIYSISIIAIKHSIIAGFVFQQAGKE
jgi:hypothetical protein